MRVVSEADAIQTLPSLLKEVQMQPVVIRDGEEEVAALVSMEDYELVRKAKSEQLSASMDRLGDQIRTRAAADGLTPDDLIKILDRKAS